MGNFKQSSNPFTKITTPSPFKDPGDVMGPVPPTNFRDLPQFRGNEYSQIERDAEIAAAIEAGLADTSGLGNRGMSEVNIPRSRYTSSARDAQGDSQNINPNISQTADGENPYFPKSFTGSRNVNERDPVSNEIIPKTNSKGNELFRNSDRDLQNMHNYMSNRGGTVDDYAQAMGLISDGKGNYAMDPSNYNRESGITTYVPAGEQISNRINGSNQSFYTASNPNTGDYVGQEYENSADGSEAIMGGKGASMVSAWSPNGGMRPGWNEKQVYDEFLGQGADLAGTDEARLIDNDYTNPYRLYTQAPGQASYNRRGGSTPLLPEENTPGGPRPDGDGDGVPFFPPRRQQLSSGNNIAGLGKQYTDGSNESYRFRSANQGTNPDTPQQMLNNLQENKSLNELRFKYARASDSLATTINDQNLARKLTLFNQGQSYGKKRN